MHLRRQQIFADRKGIVEGHEDLLVERELQDALAKKQSTQEKAGDSGRKFWELLDSKWYVQKDSSAS